MSDARRWAAAFVALYDDIDGVSDELPVGQYMATQRHWAAYEEAKELLAGKVPPADQDNWPCPTCGEPMTDDDECAERAPD